VVVATFAPFRAVRFRVDTAGSGGSDLGDLVAPPYDVLSDADVAALRVRHEHNIVHIDVPAPSATTPDRYAVAAHLLDAWLREGVLVRDDEPSFTIYRMQFVDEVGRSRDLVGVLGALEVVDEGAGRVLPHERTTPKASTDRLDLTRATRANLSPVWGLSLASGLTAELAAPGAPLGEVTVDGVRHVVERVTDPERIARISAIIAADDVLIADGHHRYGIARRLRDEVVESWAGVGATLAFVGELVADQLSIDAIHRLVSGVDVAELRSRLERDFVLTSGPRLTADNPASSTGADNADSAASAAGAGGADVLATLVDQARLALLSPDGEVTWLSAREGAFDGIRALDGAWLEHTLDGSAAVLDYQHGVAEALAALQAGRATAAILIRPTSLAEIERTAREGLLMPPKSTFFTPKLRTGFVIRPLDGQ